MTLKERALEAYQAERNRKATEAEQFKQQYLTGCETTLMERLDEVLGVEIQRTKIRWIQLPGVESSYHAGFPAVSIDGEALALVGFELRLVKRDKETLYTTGGPIKSLIDLGELLSQKGPTPVSPPCEEEDPLLSE